MSAGKNTVREKSGSSLSWSILFYNLLVLSQYFSSSLKTFFVVSHTGRNCFNLFQISFSANTTETDPGVLGVSKDQKIPTQGWLNGRPGNEYF